MTKKEFLQTIEDFLSRTAMSASTFGMTTIGSPNFVSDLRKGRECREETQNRVLKFINNYEEKKIMNHNTSSNLVSIFIIILVCWGWVANVIKLVNLDFEAPYKAEIIRGIGVPVGALGVVLGFIDFDEEK